MQSLESAARAVRDWLFSNIGPHARRYWGALIDDDVDHDDDDDDDDDMIRLDDYTDVDDDDDDD